MAERNSAKSMDLHQRGGNFSTHQAASRSYQPARHSPAGYPAIHYQSLNSQAHQLPRLAVPPTEGFYNENPENPVAPNLDSGYLPRFRPSRLHHQGIPKSHLDVESMKGYSARTGSAGCAPTQEEYNSVMAERNSAKSMDLHQRGGNFSTHQAASRSYQPAWHSPAGYPAIHYQSLNSQAHQLPRLAVPPTEGFNNENPVAPNLDSGYLPRFRPSRPHHQGIPKLHHDVEGMEGFAGCAPTQEEYNSVMAERNSAKSMDLHQRGGNFSTHQAASRSYQPAWHSPAGYPAIHYQSLNSQAHQLPRLAVPPTEGFNNENPENSVVLNLDSGYLPRFRPSRPYHQGIPKSYNVESTKGYSARTDSAGRVPTLEEYNRKHCVTGGAAMTRNDNQFPQFGTTGRSEGLNWNTAPIDERTFYVDTRNFNQHLSSTTGYPYYPAWGTEWELYQVQQGLQAIDLNCTPQPQCGEQFYITTALHPNSETHEENTFIMECYICEEKFTHANDFTIHMTTRHEGSQKEMKHLPKN